MDVKGQRDHIADVHAVWVLGHKELVAKVGVAGEKDSSNGDQLQLNFFSTDLACILRKQLFGLSHHGNDEEIDQGKPRSYDGIPHEDVTFKLPRKQ